MPYAEAISSVLWVAMILRPDIVYAIRSLAQFIQNPAKFHWEALKRLIIYLGGTKDLWLTIRGKGKLKFKGTATWIGLVRVTGTPFQGIHS